MTRGTAPAPLPPRERRAAAAFRRRWSWRTELWVAGLGWVIALALRVVHLTLRVRYVDEAGVRARRARGEQIIAAFWHDTIALVPLMVTRLRWPGRACVMLSWHRDAEIAARAVARLGIESVHGSSTRGWLGGLRGLLAAQARGEDLVIVPDGPRGPRHRAKEGVVQLARTTGLPVVAFGAVASPVYRLRSWDRLQLPWPFARVAVVASEPVRVARGGENLAESLAAVEAALARATATATTALGGRAPRAVC